ncbi:protein archease-like [Bufo gargarizans]|uniref:protein archease-like n=1 Tax=Bufo gargarizans TaxID=30331 RepID=UPI001CF49498|nr:protein archease-like [Bufo gargarizans]
MAESVRKKVHKGSEVMAISDRYEVLSESEGDYERELKKIDDECEGDTEDPPTKRKPYAVESQPNESSIRSQKPKRLQQQLLQLSWVSHPIPGVIPDVYPLHVTWNTSKSYEAVSVLTREICPQKSIWRVTKEQTAVKAKYPAVVKKHEYLDHTADVQLHAWGETLEEAFEQCAKAMFGYMTDIETVSPIDTVDVEAKGGDLLSLLYNFLDEWLYKFSADQYFIPREVKVLHIDRMNFKIRSIGWGKEFSLSKHPQGTEVKAITYSAMQICDEEKPEVFVIIDI